ncbi:hypothetical protein [Adlercreutzia aquisgranensis]|uniref:hypothetical protein n=1 Tax=Adlercreutzia aquisgranensis TaxID=2941323 RepID=UPI002040AB55|nr:hypothetical protein [Adlercreutzia aquisgranensis]
MSGPKGFDIRLSAWEQERLREEREREACLNACESLIRRIEAHREACRTLGSEIAKLGGCEVVAASKPLPRLKASSLAEVKKWHSELDWICKKVEEEEVRLRGEQLALQWERDVLVRARSVAGAVDLSAIKIDANATPASSRKTSVGDKQVRRDDIESALRAIAGIGDSSQREKLVSLLEGAQSLEDSKARHRAILEVKTEVNLVLDKQDLQAIARKELEAISHVNSASASETRNFAETVCDRQSLGTLRMMIADVVDEDQAMREQRYVENALKEVLETMGYSVGEGFTATSYGDVAFAEIKEAPHHAIRFQYSPGNGGLYSRVVSDGLTSAAEDKAEEERSCAAVFAAANKLSEAGIGVRLQSERKPGEVPVEVAKVARTSMRQRRSEGQKKRRERNA